MARTPPGRMALMVPGGVCLALALAVGLPLLPWADDQSAWTPPELARPLTEEHERVEILLDEQSLELAIADGALRRRDGQALRADDLRVRFNDGERIGGIRLAISAALAAAGIVFVAIGLLSPAGGSRRGGHG